MVGTSELCCVVKSNISDDVVLKGEPNEWATLRWIDEFGNSIAPFFTSLKSGQPFLKEMNGWQLKRYPVSFVVECILADIRQETSFYTIDPVSTPGRVQVPRLTQRYFGREQDVQSSATGTSFPLLPLRDR